MVTDFSDIIKSLPKLPGVYQFIDDNGKVIYVGKAKNLKKRVSSYFTKNHDQNKTAVLVKKIHTIEHIIVDSEQDALLLENNLIKNYKPRYNVLLKDDKTFPWIAISKEPFPRVYSTRHYQTSKADFYGPYTSARSVRIILDLFQQIFKLRTCKLSLSKENVTEGKYKVCLQYHIGNCKGPCIGEDDETIYNEGILSIRKILSGNIHEVILFMKKEMIKASDAYKFEEAQIIKEKLEILERFQSKSTVVSTKINNVDVFSYYEYDKEVYINYLRIVNGAIIQVHTIQLKRKLEESKEDLLSIGIIELRSKMNSNSSEIILPFNIDYQLDKVIVTIPKKGDKKVLLDLSQRNAKNYALNEKIKTQNQSRPPREQRILLKLQEDLHLKSLPIHIECFDNSNIQGSNPVASCVVFYNGRPATKEYRHFNIKTVIGPNDFDSMKEIVWRRYKRLIDEGKSIPQLIVIDGGKGQLNAALESLDELNLRSKVAIIGIAKRLEEIYFPGDKYPLYIEKNSESLKLIQHLRNEAHRFAITFHRQKRSQNFIKTELNEISGIGEKTVEVLFQRYKSLAKIKNISKEELASIIGKSKAEIILNYFDSKL